MKCKKTYKITLLAHTKVSLWVTCLALIFMFTKCKKFVTVAPPGNQLSAAAVYSDNSTAISSVNSIFFRLSDSRYNTPGGLTSLSLYAGLSSDEFTLWSGVASVVKKAYYTNQLTQNSTATNKSGGEFWTRNYELIYRCNEAIDGISRSNGLTDAVKMQLIGECKFLRAFIYFYLTNLYGELPYLTTTDYLKNTTASKSSIVSIYDGIIQDLKEAKSMLSESFVDGQLRVYLPDKIERVRPTTWAASALLSRVYLYREEFEKAEVEATRVIEKSALFQLSNLPQVFLKNSVEAIFQLQPVTTGTITNTQDGLYFYIPDQGPNDLYEGNPVSLSPFLVDSFELGDNRMNEWVASKVVNGTRYYYPTKYKAFGNQPVVSEYLMILRLGEQYLIRAEARFRLNKISSSLDDLNKIRDRARKPATVDLPAPLPKLLLPISSDSLSRLIVRERKVELFTELGHRWFDMKRLKFADLIMPNIAQAKGGAWKASFKLYPIPYDDILKAPQITQNDDY